MTARRKRPVVLRPLAWLTTQDAVWATIRDLAATPGGTLVERGVARPVLVGIFTKRDIALRVKIGEDALRRQLSRLVSVGIVAQVTAPAVGVAATYSLVRDVGVEPPRITAAGALDDTPTAQERMWQAMKALPSFDARDIMVATGIAKTSPVQHYLRDLSRAGYLATVEAATTRRMARFRLLQSRNSGPRPPAVRKSGEVFDRNLGRQVWPVVTP